MDENTLVIRGSRLKMAAAALVFFLIMLGGYLMVTEGKSFGWFVMVFFGFATASFFFFLLKGLPRLLLTQQGFEIITMFKPAVFAWSDLTGFYISQVSGVKLIGMNFSCGYKKQRTFRNFTERFTGVASAITNDYVKSPEEICSILNEWLERHGTPKKIQE